MKNKAFVLSMDIFAAISLAVVIIIAMTEMVSYESRYVNINSLKLGEDVLLILDNIGSLKSMNDGIIYNDLTKYLPENKCELQLMIYDSSLRFYKEIKITKPLNETVPENYESAQRVFTTKIGGARYYGIALIKIW